MGGGCRPRTSAFDCTEEPAPPGAGDLCSPDWVDSEFTSERSVGGWGSGWGVSVWFHTLLLPAGFSVSLPWASGGERGAAGAGVLRQRRTLLINGGRERSEPVSNPEINLDKMHPRPQPLLQWF